MILQIICRVRIGQRTLLMNRNSRPGLVVRAEEKVASNTFQVHQQYLASVERIKFKYCIGIH